MKKILLILLIIFTLYGCNKKQELIYDKLDPKPIAIDLDFVADTINVYQNGAIIKEDTAIYKDDSLYFSDIYFVNLYPGDYQLEIKNNEQKILYDLKVINYLPLPIIMKDDLLQMEDIEYYVLFTQEDCPGCEAVKPKAIQLYNYSLVPNSSLPMIYQLKIDDAENKSLGGSENIQDVTSVSELRIQKTPTLIYINNNKVTSYYVGSYQVGNHFGDIEPE
ncbi:MAG: hypothetical protein GX661_00165 [Acholeplasmataceae bacterium]|nr:hypothetical protein [Acholeplasmataceae bacterium]